MFKKTRHPHKQDRQLKKQHKTEYVGGLTPEEMNLVAMQMSWGYGMIPPGCLPYGYWHF